MSVRATKRARTCGHADEAAESCAGEAARGAAISCHGIRQALAGSFSAGSQPNFASKYSLESSRRDLHNALLCTAPKSHVFQKISRICQILRKFSEILRNSQFFKPIFCEKFEIAAVQKDANLVELEKCCQTHIFLQKFVLIQPRTSPLKNCKIFEKCIFRKCIFEKCIFRMQ